MGEGLKRARKTAKATRVPTGRVYEVEGGADHGDGSGRIELTVPKADLHLYPMGSMVRVTLAPRLRPSK